MTSSPATKRLTALVAIIAALALGWAVYQRLPRVDEAPAKRGGETKAVPVEAVPIRSGPIELRRSFTGTLEAHAEFVVAPKVSGRVERLNFDLADEVTRGEVVALLDDAEYVQAVARAEADLEIARASNVEANNLLQIADREMRRIEDLRQRGVSSESQRDLAMAEQLAKLAQVRVTEARIASARADLEAARIRLGYTRVDADWRGGSGQRVVAERYVDEGELVAANAPLLRIVELDPITAVFFVAERDYARLVAGQQASLFTDAFPDQAFRGEIVRIAPVFRETTRQARVEIQVENPGMRLKPGMFVRATVVVDREEEAVIVPEQALTVRDGRQGVFVVGGDGARAEWREVLPGIRQGELVQVSGEGLSGRVVTLGQQMLDDGTPLRVVGGESEPSR